jgi:hypothetical protein
MHQMGDRESSQFNRRISRAQYILPLFAASNTLIQCSVLLIIRTPASFLQIGRQISASIRQFLVDCFEPAEILIAMLYVALSLVRCQILNVSMLLTQIFDGA